MNVNAKTQKRINSLLPNGIPRYVRCYDNGGDVDNGGSSDRYTVCYTGRTATEYAMGLGYAPHYPYVVMSKSPFHPQGIGLHCSNPFQPCDTIRSKGGWHRPPAIGRKCHLGKRINFKDLPKDCQRLVLGDYLDIWGLKSLPH